MTTYEITTDALPDKRLIELPRKTRDTFDRLQEMCKTKPNQAILELPGWIERHPNIPVLYNLLALVYSELGQDDLARAAVDENYRRNSDYLFARINMAHRHIQAGDFQKVAEIFDNKFDLSLLYPTRKRFHISEFINFMSIVGLYYMGIGKKDDAELVLETMESIDPEARATALLKIAIRRGNPRKPQIL